MAAICFTQGCNLRCRYCHNPDLIPQTGDGPSWDEVLAFLGRRKGQLDGVVFTGGEPLMQEDLPEALMRIRKMGFATKLDTNGTWPERLKPILEAKSVDYLAMDLKSDASGWQALTGGTDFDRVTESLSLIKNGTVDSEIRVTFVPGFHDENRQEAMARLLLGSRRVALQRLSGFSTLDPQLTMEAVTHPGVIEAFQIRLIQSGINCSIR